MATVNKVICDGCGIFKGETNHWYMIYIGGSHGPTWQIFEWDLVNYPEKILHVCGHECAHKLLDEFLQKAQSQ